MRSASGRSKRIRTGGKTFVARPGLEAERCPHCGSGNTSFDETQFVGLELHSYFECHDCGRPGLEVFWGKKRTVYAII